MELILELMCRNAGTQIQNLARSVYKTEAKASGMLHPFSFDLIKGDEHNNYNKPLCISDSRFDLSCLANFYY